MSIAKHGTDTGKCFLPDLHLIYFVVTVR